MYLVILFELFSLLYGRVTPHGTDIDHSIPKLHKGTPLYRDIHIREIMQDEVYERLVLVLAHELDEALARELLSQPVRRQAVLGECKVEILGRVEACDGQLLRDLGEIGATYTADHDLLAQVAEEGDHL